MVDTDEGVRGETTVESLGQLRGAFEKDGTITAGNASQISDGGAAVLVMSAERCEQLGLTPIGELVSYGQVAGPDASLLTQPSHAILQAAKKADLDVKGLDLFEINEAFAAVGLASVDDLGSRRERRSTSTAAPSRSVTRSVCRARASRSRRSPNYVVAVVAWRPWPSAVAAVKATPRYCEPSRSGTKLATTS